MAFELAQCELARWARLERVDDAEHGTTVKAISLFREIPMVVEEPLDRLALIDGDVEGSLAEQMRMKVVC